MSGSVASPFRQPKAVFAVAFACVVSFMGIGLVDPILPAISHQLHASPSEVTLLFTSYLVVTAVAMLITNWVSSRLGAKKTLIAGLIHRGQQHDHYPGGDDRIAGGEAGGFGGLRLRPVHRRGPGPVRGGRLVIAVNIHFPFFIAVGAIVAGIAILSTAHSLLTEAERIQAEPVAADTGPAAPVLVPVAGTAVAPERAVGVILAAVDNSPMAARVTQTAARLAAANGRAVHVVHALASLDDGNELASRAS